MPKKLRLLRIREVAEILNVNPETLRRWDRNGSFKAIRVGKRGHRMYDERQIQKQLSKHK
ncbi:MAG: Helix-turn-helix domain protein [Microgenomates bacterium OLB22]|nr:MAG: Helix-turn-helix domain protein [Microgenomates bacterium OLB22]